MKSSTLVLSTLFFLASFSTLFAECQFTTDLELGYRRDELNWKISEEAHDFQVSSRVRFRDVDHLMLTGKARLIDTCWYFRVLADYGWTLHGHFRDTGTFTPLNHPDVGSFGENVRRGFSNDHVLDATAAIGYPFMWGPDFFVFAPLVGYSYHAQCWQMTHKRHLFEKLLPEHQALLPILHSPSRHSTYLFRWYGPFLGFDLALALQDCWSLYGEFEYHFSGKTKTKRKSNYGFERIDDFDKTDPSHGFSYLVGANYFFCSNWFSAVTVDYKWWRVKESKNKATWCSWGINGVLGYVF